MTKSIKGLIIALALIFALSLVGCSSTTAKTEKVPAPEKASEATPATPEKTPEAKPSTGMEPVPTPAPAPSTPPSTSPAPAPGGPALEEESCDC